MDVRKRDPQALLLHARELSALNVRLGESQVA